MKYGWYKCTEVLPDDNRWVLCCTITKTGLQNLAIGYYADGMWHLGMKSNVTHWMELPDPPEVDA